MKISCPECGKIYEIPGEAIEQMLTKHVHCDCGKDWLFPDESPALRIPFELYLTLHGCAGSVLPELFFQNKFQVTNECAAAMTGKLQDKGILTRGERKVILRNPLFYELMAVCESITLQEKEKEKPGLTVQQLLLYGWILLQVLLILWLLCGAPLGPVGNYFCG